MKEARPLMSMGFLFGVITPKGGRWKDSEIDCSDDCTILWLYLKTTGDFPGGPVVKTSPSNAEGAGLIPGQGAKIPHTSQKTEAIL